MFNSPKRRRIDSVESDIVNIENSNSTSKIEQIIMATDIPSNLYNLTPHDEDENEYKVEKVTPLTKEMRSLFYTLPNTVINTLGSESAAKYDGVNEDLNLFSDENSNNNKLYLLSCSMKEPEDPSNVNKIMKDYLCNGETEQIILRDCAILSSELSHTDMVQYRFNKDPTWRVARVCQEALEIYMNSKFKSWKDRLESPTCEAEFKRMLKIGLVCKIFDQMLFPVPELLKEEYQVTDDKGKVLHLPCPVDELRIWNAEEGKYKEISSRLMNAPSEGGESKYWEETIGKFKESKGVEYIEGLMK